MAAPIVYEGVNGKYEGTLFGGVKFWISARVPARQSVIGTIKDNGGKTVELEKFADVLIADHARKDAPPGSVSWKYITESVASGEIVNIEDYKIHPPIVPRPAGSTMPIKGTRTPFTKEDDERLVDWVRRKKRAGKAIKGTEIYKKFAEQYPHHTWQSWQTRWIKTLSFSYDEDEPIPPAQRPVPVSVPKVVPKVEPKIVPKAPPAVASTPPSATPNQASRPAGPKRRVPFTEEDDKLLIEYVKKCVRAGKKPRGNKIYIRLEEQYPHHTYQGWRGRWILLARDAPKDDSETESGSEGEASEAEIKRALQSPPSTDRPKTLPPQNLPSANPLRSKTSPPQNPAAASTSRPTTLAPQKTPQPNPSPSLAPTSKQVPNPDATPSASGQGMTRIQELKLKGRQVRAARTIQRVWRGHRARLGLWITAVQANAQGFLVRQALNSDNIKTEPGGAPMLSSPVEQRLTQAPHKSTLPSAREPTPSQDNTSTQDHAIRHYVQTHPPPQPKPRATISPKEQFWSDFNAYNELAGVAPVPWVQIGPYTVELWDLWRCATEEEPHHASRDWEAVCEGLGFDWVDEPEMPGLVRAAFERCLGDFERALREFRMEEAEVGESEDEDEEGGSEGEGEGGEEEDMDEEDNKEVAASQTPRGPAARPEDLDTFESSPPVFGLKRPFDQVNGLPGSSYLGLGNKRRRYDPDSEVPCTPDSRAESADLGAVERDETTPTRRPVIHVQQGHAIELESQDDRLDSHLDGVEDDESHASPSQQLLSQYESISPRPGPPSEFRRPPPSPNQPLPSVESDEDEDSDSSDAFDPPIKPAPKPKPTLPVAAPPPSTVDLRRRTLPAYWAKDKQPAPTTSISSPSLQPPTIRLNPPAPVTPNPSSFTAALTQSKLTTSRPTPTTTTSSKHSQPRREFNPLPLVNKYISLGHPPPLVVRAARAVNFRDVPHKMLAVLDSLVQGRGVPDGISGVWTDDDDRRVRAVELWLELFRGVPEKGDKDAFGGDEVAWGRFWRLVAKQGEGEVLGRGVLLRAWDES